MAQQVDPRSLKSKWVVFGRLVFEPFPLILFGATAVLLYVAYKNTDPLVIALVTVGASLFSGAAGAVITNHWNEINETGAIVARGQTAIRSLEILWNNVSTLDNRVVVYLDRSKAKELGGEVIQTYLEEVRERCSLLKAETLTSIDNWRDIIPEADVKTLFALQADVGHKESQVTQLREELAQQKDASSQESKTLRGQIRTGQEELSEAKKALADRSWLGLPLVTSGRDLILPQFNLGDTVLRIGDPGDTVLRIGDPAEDTTINLTGDPGDTVNRPSDPGEGVGQST